MTDQSGDSDAYLMGGQHESNQFQLHPVAHDENLDTSNTLNGTLRSPLHAKEIPQPRDYSNVKPTPAVDSSHHATIQILDRVEELESVLRSKDAVNSELIDKNRRLVAKIVEFQKQNKENVETAKQQIMALQRQLRDKSDKSDAVLFLECEN